MTDDAWRVEITRPAARDLKRLDAPVRERILAAFDGLKTDPAMGDIKRLTGPSHRNGACASATGAPASTATTTRAPS